MTTVIKAKPAIKAKPIKAWENNAGKNEKTDNGVLQLEKDQKQNTVLKLEKDQKQNTELKLEKDQKQNISVPITLSWENINVFTTSSKKGIKKLLWFKKEIPPKQILNNGTVKYNRIFFPFSQFKLK